VAPFWAGAHDIGKVAACFQDRNDARTSALKERLCSAGFPFHGWDKPHGTISSAVLADLLADPSGWPLIPKPLAERIAVAVGGHHGLYPNDWADVADLLRQPSNWDAARREILRVLADLLLDGVKAPLPAETSDQSAYMALAGLTSVADWIGSNQTFFPPVGCPAVAERGLDPSTYFQKATRQADEALLALGWLGREASGGSPSFQDLFAGVVRGEPRSLQRAAEGVARGMAGPSLLVVEAPMGEGKTEAAWYVADAWDRRDGQGTYVALPTMATGNQMFDRVATFLQAGPGKKNLMLQHGKAALNDRFERLKYAARTYDDERRPSAVVAEGWFAANKKHGLLAPYGVGTIDQALLAVLQTKHVFVRLFGLAGKCVILDEVHAYDAYMTTLMERLLRWLAALGCPVVLLSATLPQDKRLRLLRAYAGDGLPEPDAVPYPRLTHVTVNGDVKVQYVEADPARARTVRLGWIDEAGLARRLAEALAAGGCAAVIRNTVGLAQETYLRLRAALKDQGIDVELFHARFPFGRRRQIEDGVLRRFGRTADDNVDGGGQIRRAPHRPPRSVLVATQVVEQSLDLDFDLMVSDVAPIDLVLQRAGRLHRHARGTRAAGVGEPRLLLIEPTTKDGLPVFGPSRYVYARFVLLRSQAALKAVEAVRLPDDLERFIERVYGDEALAVPDGWRAALDEAERELDQTRRGQRTKAKGVMLYKPDDEELLRQQNAQLDEDNPEAAEKIRAATRDTEPTAQLILVYHLDGGDFLDGEGRDPFREREEPDLGRVRRLLDNELTINHGGCVAFYAGRKAPSGWRDRGMLRHHRIVRVDGSGASLPTEYPLRYDAEIGVLFTRDLEETSP
jgi:CRISPR-associated endonuclease/helicase Cas3